jgi:phage-related protein
MPVYTGMLYADDYDLGNLGLVLEHPVGHRSPVTVDHPTAAVPGRIDELALSTRGTVRARQLELAGSVVADTVSSLISRTTEIHRRLHGADGRSVRLRFGDASDREYVARFLGGPVDPEAPDLVQLIHRVRYRFVCPDPRARAVTESSHALGVAAALGDAPTPWIITVTVSSSPATIELRDSSDDVVHSMTLTGTGDWVIDSARQTVMKDGVSAVASVGTPFFDPFDPIAHGLTPKLSVTGGTGSYAYRKGWW